MVNRVKIYDENDQYLGVVQNDELTGLLGTFQEIYIKEDDKKIKAVAQSMLQGIFQEISIKVKGNASCISGKKIKVEDSLTRKLGGLFLY